MKETLIDTNILSFYLKGNEKVKENAQDYLNQFGVFNISIITYYEILSGLKHRSNAARATEFQKFCELNVILPLTKTSAEISAEIYARLRRSGTPIDDIDILIAGVAIERGLRLATNNRKDFEKIEELEIVDWSV